MFRAIITNLARPKSPRLKACEREQSEMTGFTARKAWRRKLNKSNRHHRGALALCKVKLIARFTQVGKSQNLLVCRVMGNRSSGCLLLYCGGVKEFIANYLVREKREESKGRKVLYYIQGAYSDIRPGNKKFVILLL